MRIIIVGGGKRRILSGKNVMAEKTHPSLLVD
jgi:hypothetical protein